MVNLSVLIVEIDRFHFFSFRRRVEMTIDGNIVTIFTIYRPSLNFGDGVGNRYSVVLIPWRYGILRTTYDFRYSPIILSVRSIRLELYGGIVRRTVFFCISYLLRISISCPDHKLPTGGVCGTKSVLCSVKQCSCVIYTVSVRISPHTPVLRTEYSLMI